MYSICFIKKLKAGSIYWGKFAQGGPVIRVLARIGKRMVNVFARRSWKNDARVMENHGEIMEFDSGKALGTLKYGPHLRLYI